MANLIVDQTISDDSILILDPLNEEKNVNFFILNNIMIKLI